MTGQRIEGALSAIVIIEMPNGDRYGWEILHPKLLEWEFTGIGDAGSEAKMTAQGMFLRRQPSANIELDSVVSGPAVGVAQERKGKQ